jgi:hypothetical protein
MLNIEKYQNKTPSLSKLKLSQSIFKDVANDFDYLELFIKIQDTNINIKELSSYLELIYKIDGQLSEVSFARYSHTPRHQIEISEIRFGSWDIVIERVLNDINADKLAITYFALKFLPKIIETFVEKIHTYYQILETRENYLEKRANRQKRKELRKLINDEKELDFLDKKQKEKIVLIINSLYEKVGDTTIPASRFAQKFIKDIKLLPKKGSKNIR